MDLKLFFTVYITIFLAEMGDKTQLATLLFAADKEGSKLSVFVAASLALVSTVAIAVLAGGLISHYISEKTLNIIAGVGFLAIGAWTLIRA